MWEPVALAVSPQVGAEVLVVVDKVNPGRRIISNLAAVAKEGIPRQPVAEQVVGVEQRHLVHMLYCHLHLKLAK